MIRLNQRAALATSKKTSVARAAAHFLTDVNSFFENLDLFKKYRVNCFQKSEENFSLSSELDGHKCSVYQLDIEDKRELDVYFIGMGNDEVPFPLIFCYKDIFGNSYLQQFTCHLKSDSKELNIEIGEPLLKRGEE